MESKIYSYIAKNKKFYDAVIEYIENDSQDFSKDLNDLLINLKYAENPNEFKDIFHIIYYISCYHFRYPNFNEKISQFLNFYKDAIKQNFSNIELLNIFQKNKMILLKLLKNNIFSFDESCITFMLYKNDTNLFHFFFPEIKNLIDSSKAKNFEKELLQQDEQIFQNFEEKRLIGENDTYLCKVIRNDSIDEFIQYVNQTNFPLTNKITHSIFETNTFLIERGTTTLIEYAAYFGSIQIFQYLKMCKIELKPSLWLYSIHSNNAEMIHLIEELHINPPNNIYIECLEESIKCHHNEIARYIEDNYFCNDYIGHYPIRFGFHYFNYRYITNEHIDSVFMNASKFNHLNMVILYLDNIKEEIKISPTSI